MIWLLLGYLLFGGGSLAPLQSILELHRESIEERVPEGSGRTDALESMDAFLATLEARREAMQRHDDAFVELLRRRNSTRDDFEAKFRAADAMRFEVQSDLLDLRDDLRRDLGRESWGRVFSGR